MARPAEAPPLRGLLGTPAERRAAWRYWGRDTIQGMLNLLMHHALRMLPIDACSAIGARLGETTGRTRYREANIVARRTLRRLRKDRDVEPQMREAWRQVGRIMAEFSVLDRLWPAGRIAVDGIDHVHAARATGRPVMIVGVHVGNWETIGVALVKSGVPTTMIYQPPGNRFEHRIAIRRREGYGLTLVPPRRVRALPFYRVLLERKGVGLIFLDDVVAGRVNGPALGRPLRPIGNVLHAARMAAMTDAVVIPSYVVRERGAHFRTVFLPPVTLPGDAGADGIMTNIGVLDAVIDPIVRRHLEHWHMLFEFRAER